MSKNINKKIAEVKSVSNKKLKKYYENNIISLINQLDSILNDEQKDAINEQIKIYNDLIDNIN
jgi:hypothetical protein